jgi:hypothetical protein
MHSAHMHASRVCGGAAHAFSAHAQHGAAQLSHRLQQQLPQSAHQSWLFIRPHQSACVLACTSSCSVGRLRHLRNHGCDGSEPEHACMHTCIHAYGGTNAYGNSGSAHCHLSSETDHVGMHAQRPRLANALMPTCMPTCMPNARLVCTADTAHHNTQIMCKQMHCRSSAPSAVALQHSTLNSCASCQPGTPQLMCCSGCSTALTHNR